MKLAEKQNLYLANLHFMDILMLLNMRILLVHVINPGSISQSRSNIEETFAELIINDTGSQAELNFRNRENKIIDTVLINI